MKVIVIGGGPAGMIAAITTKQNGNEVILIEKNEMLGKKLLITGKGRCNITSSLDIKDFIKNTPGNGMFLYSCYSNFTNKDIIEFLNEKGLKVKEERGNRIFPITDKSLDVLKCFTSELKRLNIEIIYNAKVTEILQEENRVKGIKYNNKNKQNITIYADKVILATGGKSYPSTGSTGDGYTMAQNLGHSITKIRPSLVPLYCKNGYLNLCKKMQGLSLKNIGMKIVDTKKNKIIYEDFGELLFTHFGVSGPTILSSSAHLLRYKDIDELLNNNYIKLVIDLKPALNEEKLDIRILRDFENEKNKLLKNSLNELLPKKMIEPIIEISKINPDKQVNTISKKERETLGKLIKNFELILSGFRPIEDAIITSGGINIKEINPKTMESKKISGLYFAGEIIDVDAYTGGFNLQIAYSTGFVSGRNI